MICWTRKSKARVKQVEHEKESRLEQAERDLFFLKHRAARAIARLDDRSSRNHWRESIEQMIQGASS